MIKKGLDRAKREYIAMKYGQSLGIKIPDGGICKLNSNYYYMEDFIDTNKYIEMKKSNYKFMGPYRNYISDELNLVIFFFWVIGSSDCNTEGIFLNKTNPNDIVLIDFENSFKHFVPNTEFRSKQSTDFLCGRLPYYSSKLNNYVLKTLQFISNNTNGIDKVTCEFMKFKLFYITEFYNFTFAGGSIQYSKSYYKKKYLKYKKKYLEHKKIQ